MKTFYEIMEEKDLNNLTPLEYAIWFLESATGASGAQQAAQDLARITAQLDAAISDLQDAVDYVYNVYGESNETLAAITTAHWRAVIADVKKKSV